MRLRRSATFDDVNRWPIGRMIGRLPDLLAALAGLILMFHIAVDVFFRNALNKPLSGTPEYVGYWWMPAIVFLGLALAERSNEHLQVTLATDGTTGTTRRVVSFVSSAVMVAMVAVVTYYAGISVFHSVSIKESVVADIRLEIWPGKIVMFAGLMIWLAQMVVSRLKKNVIEIEGDLP